MQVEKLKTIDADTLLSTPMRKNLFVVDGLIPQGLSVLSGSSKIGKSWLMLWLGIQVARGQPVWEFETHKSDVLYLCLEDTYARIQAIIVLACVIFSVFASSPPTVDTSAAAVTQVWSYVGELIFNMLVLVGSVKMADRIVREMMGL